MIYIQVFLTLLFFSSKRDVKMNNVWHLAILIWWLFNILQHHKSYNKIHPQQTSLEDISTKFISKIIQLYNTVIFKCEFGMLNANTLLARLLNLHITVSRVIYIYHIYHISISNRTENSSSKEDAIRIKVEQVGVCMHLFMGMFFFCACGYPIDPSAFY